jgi:hypothetical protein
MGNCTLKGVTGDCYKSIRVLTDSGTVLEFKSPITARDILNDHPGYGIFRGGHASSRLLDLECLISGRLYYLLPLVKDHVLAVTEPAKKSLSAASDVVENLANDSDLEVLPSVGDGVWRVKLVIDTKQLSEILSEQVNTEALIERMRMAAASSASTTPRPTKGACRTGRKPNLSNLFNFQGAS